MSSDNLNQEWPEVACEYLSNALPLAHNGEGWGHSCLSAFQMGCEALAKLGHARETEWGAVPLDVPKRPAVLPRWDDICVAVLYLARQGKELSYRLADGSLPPPKKGQFVATQIGGPALPEVNVKNSNGLGCAHVDEKTLKVFSALGLYEASTWTKSAELVFWRVQPKTWDMAISTDPRFVNALANACETIPADIRDELARLTVTTDADIHAGVAQSKASNIEMRARFGPKSKLGAPRTEDQIRSGIAYSRSSSIDWFFFRRWRMSDGWLTSGQATSALEIFHDPLAMEMRRHVILKLWPDAQIRNE
jgi:pellino protein